MHCVGQSNNKKTKQVVVDKAKENRHTGNFICDSLCKDDDYLRGTKIFQILFRCAQQVLSERERRNKI